MTEVSDSSIFSRYGFWSVNASPVSTSANLSSRSPMSDMPSHLLDRVRRPYRHLRVPRHARPHGGSSRRSPSERPRASVESEQWRQAHRANRSCSIEKRRRFTGPGLRPLRTTSRRAARDHDFRTNPAFPAAGSTRGSLPPRTSSRRPRDASGSRVALASVEELQCQPVLLLIVHRGSALTVGEDASLSLGSGMLLVDGRPGFLPKVGRYRADVAVGGEADVDVLVIGAGLAGLGGGQRVGGAGLEAPL